MKRILTKKYSNFSSDDSFLGETLFHNANGYIGVRGCIFEGIPQTWSTMRGTYINGFYDVVPMKQAEALCNLVNEKQRMLNVADTSDIVCSIDGKKASVFSGKILEHTRSLDMDKGITCRKFVWESDDGKQVEITSKSMTSFDMLSLYSIEYEVKTLNCEANVEILLTHNPNVTNYSDPNDPRTASEIIQNLIVEPILIVNDCSIAKSTTATSRLEVCSMVETLVKTDESKDGVRTIHGISDNNAVYSVNACLEPCKKITLERLCIFSDSLRCKDVIAKAKHDLDTVLSKGLNYYYTFQENYMQSFWKNCAMEIDGDDVLNSAVTFNMYQLLQSSSKDDKCSIAAKGLSGEGYEGHYFWDAETFVLPFFTLTNPEIAKNILSYRYSTLDQARNNAKLLGHKRGALYPWRTITGEECSGYFISGTAAYHIDADIAYAVIKYFFTTADEDFLADKGEEILIETARLWLDVGNYNRDGDFVINEVTGPDEYTCMIDNNFYTNCAAKYNLLWAVKLFRLLDSHGRADVLKLKLNVTDSELSDMEKAAASMLILYDERAGINPQDDSFLSKPVWDLENTPAEDFPLLLHYHPLTLYRYQVCKQADTVLAYFMFDHGQSKEVMERSFRYYEKITTHDSSLSKCVFSIVASRLGLYDEAYDYFGDSAKLDLENRHNNSIHGIHTANMGGSYMAIVNGFAGVEINENGISACPHLPENWTKLQFNLNYLGSLMHFCVTKDDVSVEIIEGNQTEIKLFGEAFVLKCGETIKVRCQ